MYRKLGIFIPIFIFIILIKSSLNVQAKESLSFHSDQESSQYVIYQSVKGDWPVAILRRLDLKPIFGKQGSLSHFFKLNPDLGEKYKANPKYQLPTGQMMLLPISKLNLENKKGLYEIKNGALKFLGSHQKRQANDYTQVLNILALQNRKSPFKHKKPKVKARQPASMKTKVKKHVHKPAPAKKAVKQKNWNDFNYDLGSSVVRVPVSVDSPLYKSLQAQGFLPLNRPADAPIYVDVALNRAPEKNKPGPTLSLQDGSERKTAAVNTTKTQITGESPMALDVQTLTGSRLYSIVDSTGQSGEIGIDPALGAQVTFAYKYSWLDLDSRLQFQTEKFKPDPTIRIEQETDSRIDFRLRQRFDLSWFDVYVGGGLGTSASFVTTSATTLQAKHLNRPYAHLGIAKSFSLLNDLGSRAELSYDSLFGVEDGLYKLETGYQTSAFLFNSWQLGSQFYLTGDLGVIYADDQPSSYEQTHFGVQMLLGVQWQFGNTE